MTLNGCRRRILRQDLCKLMSSAALARPRRPYNDRRCAVPRRHIQRRSNVRLLRSVRWRQTSLQRSGTSKGSRWTTNTRTKSKCSRSRGESRMRECISGGGGGAGKATFQDLSIVHHIDKASPLLLKACATGTHLKDAIITHRKAGKGQQEYLIVKLNDVIITGVTHGGAERPTVFGKREPGVCQGRPRIQAAKARWVARCRDSFQVRPQGQQRG